MFEVRSGVWRLTSVNLNSVDLFADYERQDEYLQE
jgi:hypothetical protein